jgi:hypothetical protein
MHNFEIGSRVRKIAWLSGKLLAKETSKTGTIIGSHHYLNACVVKWDNGYKGVAFLFDLVPESLENWKAQLNVNQEFTFST